MEDTYLDKMYEVFKKATFDKWFSSREEQVKEGIKVLLKQQDCHTITDKEESMLYKIFNDATFDMRSGSKEEQIREGVNAVLEAFLKR